MDGRGVATVVFLALLAISPGADAWQQLRGSPARSGVAELDLGAVDVLGQVALPDPEFAGAASTSPGLAETPHGWVGLLWSKQDRVSCSLVLLSEDPLEVASAAQVDGCANGNLVGYDSARDVVLLCSTGGATDPILQARSPTTGQVAWDIVPADDLSVAADRGLWTCRGGALDPATGEAIVPFTGFDGGRPMFHRIVSVDVTTGFPVWAVTVPAAAFAAGGDPTGRGQFGGVGSTFYPLAATVGPSIILVSGHDCPTTCADDEAPVESASPGAPQEAPQMAVAWFDRDGRLAGARTAQASDDLAEDGAAAATRPRTGSRWAAASGATGALALGGQLMLLSWTSGDPVRTVPLAAGEDVPGAVGLPAPVWSDRTLVVPLARSVSAFDGLDLAPKWSWAEAADWYVEDLLATPSGRLFLLISRQEEARQPDLMLLQLSMADGREAQRVPLPPFQGSVYEPTRTAKLVPGGTDTLAVLDRVGTLTLFGQARGIGGSGVALSDAYPEPGSLVGIGLAGLAARGVTGVLVNWGDGATTTAGPAETPTHRFLDPDDYNVVVTAVRADGTTETESLVVHVGGTPPPDLNFMQRAFSPGHQDTTWGIIGLVVAGTGASYAILVNRRRRSALGVRLRDLDAVGEAARSDAVAGLAALHEARSRIRAGLAAGELEDAAFHVLEGRADKWLRTVRTRALAPYRGRMSPAFEHLLEAALDDGFVSAAEGELLDAGLGDERRLSREEKERLRAVLARLAREPTAGRG